MCIPAAFCVEVGDQLLLGSIRTIDGRVIDQSYWNQRNTIVQVWATWCPFCKKQNINVDQLMKKIPPHSLNRSEEHTSELQSH